MAILPLLPFLFICENIDWTLNVIFTAVRVRLAVTRAVEGGCNQVPKPKQNLHFGLSYMFMKKFREQNVVTSGIRIPCGSVQLSTTELSRHCL